MAVQMRPTVHDIRGRKFAALEPLAYAGRSHWACRCALCGGVTVVRADNIKRGTTKTCGQHSRAEVHSAAA
jgi:hypothetical protein